MGLPSRLLTACVVGPALTTYAFVAACNVVVVKENGYTVPNPLDALIPKACYDTAQSTLSCQVRGSLNLLAGTDETVLASLVPVAAQSLRRGAIYRHFSMGRRNCMVH